MHTRNNPEDPRIVHGKRHAKVPNRLGAPPGTYRDNHGVTHLNPGNSEITRVNMKLSGDSMKDIAMLQQQTGQGYAHQNQVWHHMSDYNPETGYGTVVLMPADVHRAHPHTGGSAMRRADMYDDPDKKAKYGV